MQNEPGDDVVASCSVAIKIARDASDVFKMVADLTRMGEWSPYCKACWFDDGGGMVEGQWFYGRNEEDGKVAESRNLITQFDPQRTFAFHTGGDLVRWQYDFLSGTGETTVTETWELLPAGIALFEKVFGTDALIEIEAKRRWAKKGMARTLKAIKCIAESEVMPSTDRGV